MMDKSWMQKPRVSPEYLNGVKEFLNFAFDRATNRDKILCPRTKCCNRFYKNKEDLHGPVQYQWMYPIKRYLHRLKSYVRNGSHPKGSITEGCLSEECSTFCLRYLHEIETKFNRPVRNYDGGDAESHEKLSIFLRTSHTLGKATSRTLSTDEWERASLYMLSNCDEVTPYVHDLYGLVFCANYCLWKERHEIARGARCNKISINCARSCISYL
ncbi:hypothetical protein AAC387_Pa03g2065 [Persea americana]